MTSVLTLAQLAVASDAFDKSQQGKEKKGMDSVAIAAFFDELERMEKDASYDPVGEARSFKNVIHQVHAAKQARLAAAVTAPAKSMMHHAHELSNTMASPVRAATKAVAQQAAPAAKGGLRRNLAIGGAVLGAGVAGHMVPQHQNQQQPQQMH